MRLFSYPTSSIFLFLKSLLSSGIDSAIVLYYTRHNVLATPWNLGNKPVTPDLSQISLRLRYLSHLFILFFISAITTKVYLCIGGLALQFSSSFSQVLVQKCVFEIITSIFTLNPESSTCGRHWKVKHFEVVVASVSESQVLCKGVARAQVNPRDAYARSCSITPATLVDLTKLCTGNFWNWTFFLLYIRFNSISL